MIAFLLSPIGKYLIAGAAALGALWLVYSTIYDKGAQQARGQIERENTDARNKADEARSRAERDADAGTLRDDDGFKRH